MTETMERSKNSCVLCSVSTYKDGLVAAARHGEELDLLYRRCHLIVRAWQQLQTKGTLFATRA